METQKSLNSQSNSEQKSFNVVGIPISNIKQYYRTVIIKTAWNWQKNRQEDQGVRILDPVIHPHIYSQLMFIKGAQNTQWRKYSPVQQMLLGKLDIQMWKTETRSLCLSPCTKINLKSKELPKQNSKVSTSKRNNGQMGLHQTKVLLHSKGNNHQTQETAQVN
jgi:hypothetical protein